MQPDFRLDGLPPGRYAVGFFHPALDALGLELPPRAVAVPAGGTARADLAVPSAARLVAARCPARGAADSTGLLVGRVLDGESDLPVAGARVTVEWTQLVLGGPGRSRRDR